MKVSDKTKESILQENKKTLKNITLHPAPLYHTVLVLLKNDTEGNKNLASQYKVICHDLKSSITASTVPVLMNTCPDILDSGIPTGHPGVLLQGAQDVFPDAQVVRVIRGKIQKVCRL